jgi:predicted nucleotidyltransferase
MQTETITLDWSVTRGKVDEAIRRIVAAADPLQIIAFGSRARGDHRPDSDLDLAVIVDAPEEEVRKLVPSTLISDIGLPVDLVAVSKSKYDLHRPWLNSVYNYIDSEGIVLYDREHPESARPNALHVSPGGRVFSSVRVA